MTGTAPEWHGFAVEKRTRGVGGAVAIALLVVSCVLCGGAAIAGRHAIATSVARDRLLERGIECDERFAVTIAWGLDEATVGPTYCTVASGAIASFELVDPVRVALEDQQPTRLDGGAVRVTVRQPPPPPDPEAGEWGPFLDALAIPDRVGLLVGGIAQLAASAPPPVELASIEVVRDGAPVGALAGVHVDGAAPLGVRVDRIALPALSGPLGARASATILALESTATASRVDLAGDLEVDAALAFLGSGQHRMRLRIIGDDLETASPRYRVSF